MKIKNEQRTMLSNSLLITFLLSAVIALTGCEQEGPAEKTGKKLDQEIEKTSERIQERAEDIKKNVEDRDEAIERKSESVGEYIDDSAITGKVKAEMMADSLISASRIDVVTDKGVVKLSGVVNAQQTADRAVEIASRVKGVKSVENNLVVSPVVIK
ncbi:MAG: BON domain-containing protein [Methylococcaceae bacterium]